MADHTYSDYIYFKNMTDTPNKQNTHFILNQIPDLHITSPFKLMDGIYESLPKLLVVKMLKTLMKSHVQILAHLSKVNVWNK